MQTSALQDAARVASRGLYRDLVRECRRFPDVKTRVYFVDQAREALGGEITGRAFEAQRRILRRLQAANAGYLHAIKKCMAVAHGQQGKPRRRKIEEMLRETRNSEVAPLQSGNLRTRPPLYTPRLQAYLTSQWSHNKGKAPTKQQLQTPPKMPERANPDSEEARLLGRLHPKREANIKWRYLSELRGRLLAPQDPRDVDELAKQAQTFKLSEETSGAGIALPAEQEKRFKEHERRFRKHGSSWGRPKRITSRFMRRRYEELLSKGITMDAVITKEDQVRWNVRQAPGRREIARRFVATEEDQAWSPPT